MDRAKLRELQERYKKEVREGVRLEDLKAGSYTRTLAERLEEGAPGKGIELTLLVCADPLLAGCTIYLQQLSGCLIQSTRRWIRGSGLENEELRAVTGMSESHLRYVMETCDVAPEDSIQMRLF